MGTVSSEQATGDPATPLERLEPLLLVAVGGFVGAVLRHAVGVALPAPVLPWGTLVANVLGSLALGVLLYEAHLAGVLSAETRLVVGTGFLSSFTTYSTFAVETTGLAPELAAVNVALNYALGFSAIVCGRWVAWVVSP
jgi:CrcB protein